MEYVGFSGQRLSWAYDDEKWHVADFVRPPVALLSDTGEHLYNAMYGVPIVEPWCDVESVGCSNAEIAILHFDLDGHPANARTAGQGKHVMDTKRKECLGEDAEEVLLSLYHCNNHCNGLNERATVNAIDSDLSRWLWSAGEFLSMGGTV